MGWQLLLPHIIQAALLHSTWLSNFLRVCMCQRDQWCHFTLLLLWWHCQVCIWRTWVESKCCFDVTGTGLCLRAILYTVYYIVYVCSRCIC